MKLAKLARIEIGDEEAENLSHEFDAILNYVSEIKKLDHKNSINEARPSQINVMRGDGEPHEAGIYTEKILEQAPSREGDYIKVKKII